MGAVKVLDKGICNGLLSRLRGIESEDVSDRRKWLGVSLAFLVCHSFARGIRYSVGIPEVILGVLSTCGGNALRLGISPSNTGSADPFPLTSALYIKALLPDPRGCPSGALGVSPATEVTEEILFILVVVCSDLWRFRSLLRRQY